MRNSVLGYCFICKRKIKKRQPHYCIPFAKDHHLSKLVCTRHFICDTHLIDMGIRSQSEEDKKKSNV